MIVLFESQRLARDGFQQLLAILSLTAHQVPQHEQRGHDHQQQRVHPETERMHGLRDGHQKCEDGKREREILAEFHTCII